MLSHSSAVTMLKGEDAAAGDLLAPRLAARQPSSARPEPLPPGLTP